MIAKAEIAHLHKKPAPISPKEQMLNEVQEAFRAAAMSPDAAKGLANLEKSMQKMAAIDGGSHSVQFQNDIATLNSKMEPDRSLSRVLPLMKIVGIDTSNHVRMFDQADGKVENLVVASDGILGPAAPLDATAHHKLYATSDGKKNGWRHVIKPQYVEQARIGDCYFLAGVQALAAKNPLVLKNMIHDNGARPDGSHTYTVRFPAARDKPITVNEPTIYETTALAQDSGGLWSTVVEKAHRKLTSRMLIDNGGDMTSPNGFPLLSGTKPELSDVAHSNIESKLASINKKSFMGITNSRQVGAVVIDAFRNHVQLVGGHMYSVHSYDEKKKLVTLGNPWGENRAEVLGLPDPSNQRIHTKFDAVFTSDLAEPTNVVRNGALVTIKLEDYKKNFAYMAVAAVPKR